MQTLEFKANDNAIIITIDRTALNSLTLGAINDYLQDLMPRPSTPQLTAAELRRLPQTERNAILAQQAASDRDYEILDDDQELLED